MLKNEERFLYVYVVARDFGFAPNPFHGWCTLATCKPDIRKAAKVGDWVMGVGGSRLKATGKCIYLMNVSEIVDFNDYWKDPRFRLKKPYRNGSSVMMLGDNVYHKDDENGDWIQEDSHHSNSDGSTNIKNLKTDTGSVNVLIAEHFYYFGSNAPNVDLDTLGYKNIRNFRKMSLSDVKVSGFIRSLEEKNMRNADLVLADPFDFSKASKRVDQSTGKIS
jgi:hypothetical protein